MNHKESAEQIALFGWAAWMSGRCPELNLMYHIPNGGKRNALEAARLKREGVKAGVSDIHLPVARGGYHGLWIEMKALDGDKPTQAQQDWLDSMNSEGHFATACYGAKEAQSIIEGYLSQR